jgi:hypothetical protein
MRFLVLVIVLASTYFVEWIPNNNAETQPAPTSQALPAPGEFPWQL